MIFEAWILLRIKNYPFVILSRIEYTDAIVFWMVNSSERIR
ncbi:MAG: hypothetical protein QXL15_03425 [Candidatus Korarchaeota archaeon]